MTYVHRGFEAPALSTMRAWHCWLTLAVCMVSASVRAVAADNVSVCNTWNVYGARVKLRDYPGKAGPIRHTGLQNYNACYSVTLAFLDWDSETTQYAVVMDGFADEAEECHAYFTRFMMGMRLLNPADINDWLNANQIVRHNYSFVDGWFGCCDDQDQCNTVVQPPHFQLGSVPLTVNSCNSFNEDRGWRFFNNPAAAKPVPMAGNFSSCFSFTIQLGRGTQSMYYSEMGGYNPDLFDGFTSCTTFINRTLNMYARERRFETKFNYNFTNAWLRCCNASNCNRIVIPPALLTASILLPAPLLQLACMLLALAFLTFLNL